MTDEHRCITCSVLAPAQSKPNHYERANVCESCRKRGSLMLGLLPTLCARLPESFPRGMRPEINGTRIRSTPQPTEPLAWTAFDLDAPARHASRALMARAALGLDLDQIGDLSVATILDTWVRDWRDELRIGDRLPDPDVPSLCAWLKVRFEDACDDHPAIDEFAADLKDLLRSVRRAVGDTLLVHRLPAPCPDCDLLSLSRDDGADYVECDNCHRLWTEDDYQRLCVVLAAEERV